MPVGLMRKAMRSRTRSTKIAHGVRAGDFGRDLLNIAIRDGLRSRRMGLVTCRSRDVHQQGASLGGRRGIGCEDSGSAVPHPPCPPWANRIRCKQSFREPIVRATRPPLLRGEKKTAWKAILLNRNCEGEDCEADDAGLGFWFVVGSRAYCRCSRGQPGAASGQGCASVTRPINLFAAVAADADLETARSRP